MEKHNVLCIISIFLASWCFIGVTASTGDRSQMFYSCLQKCLAENCTAPETPNIPSLHLQLLQWTCSDECKYLCMWPTVDWFVNAGIGVQQFFGKWPFTRFLGIQEPAATLFSLLNLISHVWMLKRFRENVPSGAPYYFLVHIYCFVCAHAWFWSSIFHIRDLRFTELMDYLGALSMVLFSVYHFVIRAAEISNKLINALVALAFGFYFFYHSYTVFFVKMDYGYNMIINIAFGAANLIGWLVWYLRNKKKLPYSRNCARFVFLVAATTIFEVWDFPPLFWILDAHALWHLVTSPLALIWYKFLIDDCRYLHEKQLGYGKLA